MYIIQYSDSLNQDFFPGLRIRIRIRCDPDVLSDPVSDKGRIQILGPELGLFLKKCLGLIYRKKKAKCEFH